jgi:hypothetical protein
MNKSNCIVFAFDCWFKRGGFLVVRKSNYGWWPHFIWTEDLKTYREFVPTQHTPDLSIPPLWFRGSVLTTNRKQQDANLHKH